MKKNMQFDYNFQVLKTSKKGATHVIKDREFNALSSV